MRPARPPIRRRIRTRLTTTARVVFAALSLAGASSARADEPAEAVQDPKGTTPEVSTAVASPVSPAPKARLPVSYAASPMLIALHLGAGVEPHSVGNPLAFAVGGQLLWRGIVGVGLGLYATSGSPLKPAEGETGLPDRATVALSLAVRPAALYAWDKGDSWLSRFLTGISVEAGPTFEYLRTSSLLVPGCAIQDVAYKPGGHFALGLDLPLFGDARSGWIAFHVMQRVSVASETQLAPLQPAGATTCRPQVVQPSLSTQTILGFAYFR